MPFSSPPISVSHFHTHRTRLESFRVGIASASATSCLTLGQATTTAASGMGGDDGGTGNIPSELQYARVLRRYLPKEGGA